MGSSGNDRGGFRSRGLRHGSTGVRCTWIGRVRVGRLRHGPICGQRRTFSKGDNAGQYQVKGPASAPAEDVSLRQQGVDSDEKKESGAAQAANQYVTVHLGPPCDSPRRRTTSQTPRPIRNTGQVNSMSRPWKISNCPRRKRTPRAMRTTAPTGAPRCQNPGCQYADGSGGIGGGGAFGSTGPAVGGVCHGWFWNG